MTFAADLKKLGVTQVVTERNKVMVTPEVAELLLTINDHNRNIRWNRVTDLAQAIVRGEWQFNGDAIRVSTTGRLLDGQHRLWAVMEADLPIESLVVLVPDEHAQDTIDTGAKRSFGDVLKMRGERHVMILASATRSIWAWEQDGIPSTRNKNSGGTNAQLSATLDRHPHLRDAVAVTPPITGMDPSPAAALNYLFSQVDHDDADEFFRLLKTGEGLTEGHPILVLRDRLIREATQQAYGRTFGSLAKCALVIKAWNHWRAGHTISKLAFKAGGTNADRFPLIDGLEYPKGALTS